MSIKTTIIRVGLSAAFVVGMAVSAPSAVAADGGPALGQEALKTVSVAGVEVAEKAPAETKKTIAADPVTAAAAANACGTGYTISVYAERLPDARRFATLYVWTNGKTTGSSFYDKPVCAVLYNETGATQSMGIRLRSNYTSDAPTEDFGSYASYAGPVYQNRGYCGTVYSYMKMGGQVVIDTTRGVGACN
ncbi:hypothetical protein ACFWM0_24480 [Streptomyces sp. NPDC058405]|uniref:hypothetical protein n=1 Tax=Streptomyces sp. NPDC058405 TaxID=3346482 RepID=UPI00365B4E86